MPITISPPKDVYIITPPSSLLPSSTPPFLSLLFSRNNTFPHLLYGSSAYLPKNLNYFSNLSKAPGAVATPLGSNSTDAFLLLVHVRRLRPALPAFPLML